MTKQVAILACSGYRKIQGLIVQEIALRLQELDPSIKQICPPLFCVEPEKYQDVISKSEIIIIDGCASRCATKMLEEQSLKKIKKIFLPDLSKTLGIKIQKGPRLNEDGLKLADKVAKKIIKDIESEREKIKKPIVRKEFDKIDYFEVTYDKFQFRVPKKGYHFIENDSWVKRDGNKALIGITDYLQTKAGDVLFLELPEIGTEFDQFDEVVDFESVKAVLQLIGPVSGKVIAVNEELLESAELLNNDPYEHGWVVELELLDFEEEEELLMIGEKYFEYMKKKIESEL
ncbi:MAG: glycine cleavage system protein H [Candidatus Heimdallarchaeota archaeon]|nr:glycine cleavage system protein H [Candidatus Heimdallarchaeota archaeon]MBY8995093.1 glycine cleavage system protein H [Candidatus Heimdallarchaeota archaeon]